MIYFTWRLSYSNNFVTVMTLAEVYTLLTAVLVRIFLLSVLGIVSIEHLLPIQVVPDVLFKEQ